MKQSDGMIEKTNLVVSFPLWNKEQQDLLIKILPSILFTSVRNEDKVLLKRSTLFSEEGVTVKFTGYQLNQEDFDVWMFLVDGARKSSRNYWCSFNTSNVLNFRQGSHLERCIEHLIACAIEVESNNRTYCSGLVSSFEKDEVTQDQEVILNSDFVKLFKKSDSEQTDPVSYV
jgi:hypothetical protein